MTLARTTQQEKRELRIRAISAVCGKTIDRVETSNGAHMDICFKDGTVLTLALTDTCEGQRILSWDPLLEGGDVLMDLSFVSLRGQISHQEPGVRNDLIRLRIMTNHGLRTISFHNSHKPRCQSFNLRYKIAVTGTIHEGSW